MIGNIYQSFSFKIKSFLTYRRWMVVRDGRHLSQRVFPRMALIQPSFVKNGLLLQAPNMPELFVPLNPLPKQIMHCQ